MKNKLFEDLPMDEQNEDEGTFTLGDALAYQFYRNKCTNWFHTVEEMKDKQISAKDFVDWIKNEEEDMGGPTEFTKRFDRRFFAELGSAVGYQNGVELGGISWKLI